MDNKKIFKEQKYCLVKNAISKDLASIFTNYALFDEMNEYSPEGAGTQVPQAHSKYADPLMESLLLYMLPTMEENTGLTLYPTYSYFRVYRVGDDLKPHTDRESCEISSTLCLGYNYAKDDTTWPIYVNDTPFSLSQGDMVIYRGIDLNHYRDSFIAENGSYHVQCFLHYVDKNGPHSDFKFDRRGQIGIKM